MTDTPDHVARIQEEWRRERPDLDVAPQGVIGRLHRVAALLTDELVAVYREHGLGEGDFDVLATLRRAGAPYERTPGELAEHTMITTGGMTKRIDRLEAAGLVTRRSSERDGRGRVVALTELGRERIDAAVTAHLANERRLLDQLDPADAAELERILTLWLARLP
ncbi:MAG: MarR family winged helix-turn-helix transcriptional regulator [Leifsonia sp.]|uniref:MarR family winged helix-turn-helix transcriptional regulator n=1 Tax=Leifsonia sp. TaxID=1870902 RepID=UPI003F7E01B8